MGSNIHEKKGIAGNIVEGLAAIIAIYSLKFLSQEE